MAQAPKYIPTTDFSQDELNNVGGRSTVGTAKLDAETGNISASVNSLCDNLALLQRDDGALRDGVVQTHSLDANVRALIVAGGANFRGAWATATVYARNDWVTQSGQAYACAIPHTSGVFSTDFAAVRWFAVQANTSGIDLSDPTTPTNGTGAVAHGDLIAYPSSSIGFVVQSSAMRGNILKHLPRNEWAAVLAHTSTYDCTAKMQDWFAEISASNITGVMPDGKFIWNGGIVTQSGIRIRGASRPRLNAARTALVGGSRVVGTLRFSGAEIELENIGVDRGAAAFPSSPGDALVLSGLSVGTYARLQNVIGLGRSADDAFHAILVEGYENVDVSTILGCRTWYGNALKLKKGSVKGVRGYENAISGCILRSNSGDGICEDINVDDVITVGRGRAASGSGGSDYGFYIVVDNQAQRIQCTNINSRSAKQAIAWRTNANLTELNITNAVASACESGFTGFTGAGDLYSAQLQSCTAVECSAWALRAEKGVSIQVDGFFGMAEVGSAYLDELIRIEAPVTGTLFDNIKLTSNYSNSTVGSIRLLNGPTANILGSNLQCRVQGNVPQPGYVLSTQTGLAITLSPDYSPTLRHHVVSQRGGSAGTVTNIGREYSPGATRFPRNSILVVKNDDTQALTISGTATNVVTKTGGSTVVAASGVVMFVFDGANWVEV